MMRSRTWERTCLSLALVAACACAVAEAGEPMVGRATASSGGSAAAVLDGDRFSTSTQHAWTGSPEATDWWWEVDFGGTREIGAILQVVGQHETTFTHAPRSYVWQASPDGQTWTDIPGTARENERRLFRLHRLATPVAARYLRMLITAAVGPFPVLREIEVYKEPDRKIEFPEWLMAVSTLEASEGDQGLGAGSEFIPLARSCEGWEHLFAQCLWIGHFDEEFVSAEPRPLAAFLSGNFKDWCEKDRTAWVGLEGILLAGHLPMWASCGGAQGLAILAESGTDQPWDCPHCRDTARPHLPIYTHIGHTHLDHTSPRPCGDYEGCRFERGPTHVRQLARDPVFAGLPNVFEVIESHCGQVAFTPPGWMQVATCGPGGQTAMQALRVRDRYVYAAQFHIEMEGTPEVSRRIMGNFLRLARSWGGYNPAGQPVDVPELIPVGWDSIDSGP